MITADKARFLMLQQGDNKILSDIENVIIATAKSGITRCEFQLPDYDTAMRISTLIEGQGFKAHLGWADKGSEAVNVVISWR